VAARAGDEGQDPGGYDPTLEKGIKVSNYEV
jgi:hypothetical protein